MSGQPSLSKSAATTPRPYRPPGFRIPACSETSVKVPSRLLWNSALRPFGRPLGPHITGSPFQTQFGLAPARRRGAQIQIHVVGDEKVDVAVAVVIQKGAAGAPARARNRQFCLGGDVGEFSVAQVAIENVVAVVGDQHVGPPVVIVVGHADALSPAFLRDAGLARHFGEVAVSVVVIQLRGDWRLACRRGRAWCRSR